jgi:ribosomal protein L44E
LELREIIIRCCEEIRKLITNNDELLSDIKPELSQWLKWASERLMRIKCEKCGQEFTTIDEEAGRFLASLLIGVLEQYVKYCPHCRTITPKLFSDWIVRERRRVIEEGSSSPLGSPFHRTYWKPMGEAGDRLWNEIWDKTDALIHVLRARELEEA